MSEHPKACPCCSARQAALRYFADHVGDGEVGAFIDGLLQAVVKVAAAHVLPGREPDERRLLVELVGTGFDRAVCAQAEADAAEETRQ